MKTSNLFLLAIGFLFFACTTLSGQNPKAKYNIDDSKIALQGYSPVSYIDLGLAQRGSKAFKSEHDGISYYFTDAKQKATFDKNPSKYLPEYGGFCAFGIYAGAKFRPDPNKFIIKNGKLYLFLYNIELDAQQLWLAEDEKKLVKKADQNWENLQQKI